MGNVVCGAPLPSEPQERWYPVISPKGESPLLTILLADSFTGVWTHWDRRVLPCYESSDCPHCKKRMPNRWSGYIACYCQTGWGDLLKGPGRAVQAISEGAARKLLDVSNEYGTLRGVAIKMKKRFAWKESSPYDVEVRGRADVEGLHTEHDIWSSLNRMFGLNEDFWQRHTSVRAKPHAGPVNSGVQLPGDRDERYAGRENQPTKEQVERFRRTLGDVGKMD